MLKAWATMRDGKPLSAAAEFGLKHPLNGPI
jgi:hypothetical protein